MQEEIRCLRDAIKAATKRKSCKRQYIQAGETLAVSEVAALIVATASNSRDDSDRLSRKVHAERRCSRCSKTGHKPCTFRVQIEAIEDSNTSK